jgi:hypothetical protein
MNNELIWSDGIELALNDMRNKSVINADYHKKNYYFFKGYIKYFRIPTIIFSGMNSVFSVGLQPYLSQSIISVLCCSISLICGIIASIELFLGLQNVIDNELMLSKEFYILSYDIFKTLSVERQYRTLDGKIYLDNTHTKYCNLIEKGDLLNIVKEKMKRLKIDSAEEELKKQIDKEIQNFISIKTIQNEENKNEENKNESVYESESENIKINILYENL